MKRIIFSFIIIISLIRCAPESDFEAIPYTKKLVVDGFIETNGFARVQLSYSAAYFQEIDSANIRDLLVTTAKVSVSDGSQEEVLTLRRDDKLFPPYYYEGTSIKGKAGGSYKLKIEHKGGSIRPLLPYQSPRNWMNFGLSWPLTNSTKAFCTEK